MDRPYSGLYAIVDQQCNAVHIHALLKRYKDSSDAARREIRVSGVKKDLIENLRRAVSLDLIPETEVHQLVQQSEEHGHQHIFLFHPRNDTIAKTLRRSAKVASLLFGADGQLDQFPLFDRTQNGQQWADFRSPFYGRPDDWMAKLYAHELVTRVADRTREELGGGAYRVIIEYQPENYSTVFVIRWKTAQELLEIRLDQTGMRSKEDVGMRLNMVFEQLAPLVTPQDLVPWDLRESLSNMLLQRKRNLDRYLLGTCRLLDQRSGSIEFNPYDPDEELDADTGRSRAINDLLNSGARGSRMCVVWKQRPQSPDNWTELRTVVTGDGHNELVVTAKTTAAVLDYVTDQLGAFAS